MKRIRINFSPIINTSVVNDRYEDVLKIAINEGGGIGGARREIIGHEVGRTDLGFLIIKKIIDEQLIKVNPRYISTIETINITSVFFRHENSNFPSGKRKEWYSHNIETEIDFIGGDNNGYPTPKDAERDHELNLIHIYTEDYR
jgi:hypothetical protein